MCMCVCLEGVHQECGKHISIEQISCFLIFGQEYIWFVVSVAVVHGSSSTMRKTHAEECGKHISESSAIIDNLFLWKHIIAVT